MLALSYLPLPTNTSATLLIYSFDVVKTLGEFLNALAMSSEKPSWRNASFFKPQVPLVIELTTLTAWMNLFDFRSDPNLSAFSTNFLMFPGLCRKNRGMWLINLVICSIGTPQLFRNSTFGSRVLSKSLKNTLGF